MQDENLLGVLEESQGLRPLTITQDLETINQLIPQSIKKQLLSIQSKGLEDMILGRGFEMLLGLDSIQHE